MQNPWLAVGATTNARQRAREVWALREHFLDRSTAGADVRAPIAESWSRSAAAGIDPALRAVPTAFAEAEAAERFREHALAPMASLLRQPLATLSSDAEHLLAITDADGRLLVVDGDPGVRLAAAEEMNFVAGASFGEREAGTNAIGTALAAGHPVQVFAGEHFCDHSQWWTCVAAPIRLPGSDEIVGSIGLTSRLETVHPHTLALVMTASGMFEAYAPTNGRRVGARASSTPPPAVVVEALGRDRPRVRVGSREPALSLRHSEIVVLLTANPGGLSAEQLALALYGDAGKPVTARAEVSRLRRVLGPSLATEPYRLNASVRADLVDVQGLLRAGRVADAARRYAGPLLPRSEAPGIVDLRQELEGWMRRAVLAGEDVEVIWSWLDTASGAEDTQAWKRFLTHLPHEDGRRGLAAARLERLRALFGASPISRS